APRRRPRQSSEERQKAKGKRQKRNPLNWNLSKLHHSYLASTDRASSRSRPSPSSSLPRPSSVQQHDSQVLTPQRPPHFPLLPFAFCLLPSRMPATTASTRRARARRRALCCAA